jgi:hypothetical protein
MLRQPGRTAEALMRIYGPNGNTAPAATQNARRAGGGGFRVSQDEGSQRTGSTTAPRAIGGIDALLALQGVEDPVERRRRAIKRGRTALDALDELKLGLLEGTLDRATLHRLRAAAAGLKDASGDPGLDALLAEIELRVEVELAKAGIP